MNYYASTECPVGCGEVIYLKAIDSDRVFCHCTGCGCCWANPEDAQFEKGLNDINPISKFASNGVSLPSLSDIEKAGFGASVFGTCEGDGSYSAKEINEDAYKNA